MDQQTTEPAPEPQGSHMYLMTLQKPLPHGGGFAIGTWSGTWNPPPAATRHDALRALREDIARRDPQFVDASVLFFDVQPNRL